jgi:16S rRNA (adenine1518-N6/adenine1519-N6)-dimethyltransferase
VVGQQVAKKVASRRHHPEAESLLAETRGLLRRFDLKARKGLGQHFLIDEEVLKITSTAAELTPDDVVVEIGPGLGVLTRELASQAGWVIAVEIDSKLAAILRQALASVDNVSIVNDDILNINPAELSRDLESRFPGVASSPFRYKVVANLPYYIASAVLRHFLEAAFKPQIMVVMVQKEVAEAIVAEPGQMSLLSVSVQFYGAPAIVSYVPARCFYPAPEVDSAILRINVYPQPVVAVANVESFFGLVRAGFSAPRKQMVNSLAHGLELPKTEVLSLLEAAGVTPQRRAETLTLDEWAQLWQICTKVGRLAL